MAADSPRKRLRCEATCSICLDYFIDPVMLSCTHSFCQICITQYSKDSGTDLRCPQCRQAVKRDFTPNRMLMTISEISQQMDLSVGIWPNCETHREPLRLFCKDDGTLLCAVDNVAEDHGDHAVVPVDQAVQEYKDQLLSCIETLKMEKTSIRKSMEELKDKTKSLCSNIDSNKNKIRLELRLLRLFLRRHENILIEEMEEAQDTIENTKGNYTAFFNDELIYLEEFISTMEEAYRKPPAQFLKGAKSILQRYEKKAPFQPPVFEKDVSKWTDTEFREKTFFVKGIMQHFKDNWKYGLILQQVDVILDPATAHPDLIISEDGKTVRHRGGNGQDLAKNPEGGDERPSVLGRQIITEGRHCWDIILGTEGEWAVGIAMKSPYLIHDVSSLWRIGKWQGKYKAFNPPYYYNRDLHIKREPEKIRVSLNYEGGRMAFYDPDSGALLTVFTPIPFCGQWAFPFFEVSEKGHLTICPGTE